MSAVDQVFKTSEYKIAQDDNKVSDYVGKLLAAITIPEADKEKIREQYAIKRVAPKIYKSNFADFVNSINSESVRTLALQIYNQTDNTEIKAFLNKLIFRRQKKDGTYGNPYSGRISRDQLNELTEIQQKYYRQARAIIRAIRNAIALERISSRKISDLYLQKRLAYSQAASTGNPLAILGKLVKKYRKYEVTDIAEQKRAIRDRITAGQVKSMQSIINKVDQGYENMGQLSAATVAKFKEEKNKNKQGSSQVDPVKLARIRQAEGLPAQVAIVEEID